MNEQTALVRHEPQSVIRTMDDAERAALAMAKSGFFKDASQAAQAVVKILAGQELGFGPFASMTGVNIIQGKPTLAANLLAAAVKRNGKYNYKILKMDNAECVLEFYEGGAAVGQSAFTMEDAKRAGVTANPTWTKYPRNMLFARALSNGQKWYAPDIFNGATVYTPEELGAEVNEDGEMVGRGPAWTAPAVEAGEDKPAAQQPLPIGVTAVPAPAADNAPMTYEEAQAFPVAKGSKQTIGQLSKPALDNLINHSGNEDIRLAATIVLQHDFGMEPAPAE